MNTITGFNIAALLEDVLSVHLTAFLVLFDQSEYSIIVRIACGWFSSLRSEYDNTISLTAVVSLKLCNFSVLFARL